ncbi:MAG: MFS transporter [Chloroflexi bacterium]|nr:MFS transporter [Chloroflexota bacterium]
METAKEKVNRLSIAPDKRVLPVISVIAFLSFLDTPLLIPIMALYATQLGAGISTIGVIIGVYSIVHAPANLLFGRLIDRAGYKAPLIIGLTGDAISMLLYTLSRNPLHLVLIRLLHGSSSAIAGPATMLVFAGYASRTGKGRIMSFYGIAMAGANLVGYGVSGVIASRLGYPAIFLTGATLLVLAIVLAFLLPGGRPEVKSGAKIPAGESLRQMKSLLAQKRLRLAYAAIFAQYFSFGGVATLLPLHVTAFGMSAFHVGMLMVVFTIAFIALQFPSGILSDRVGRVVPTSAGLGLGILSLLVLPSAATFPLMAAAMGTYGVAFGLIFPSISALVAEHAPAERRGLASGMFYAALTAGVAIGAPVMGWVGEALGIKTSLALSAIVMGVALIIALTNLRHRI